MRRACLADVLDFNGKTVLVVGGSSGIGNGIAQAFLRNGAQVHVWGTRAAASDYAGEEGSDLSGLSYAHMDVSDFAAVEAYAPPFAKLDVLVNCQGIVLYKRGEFASGKIFLADLDVFDALRDVAGDALKKRVDTAELFAVRDEIADHRGW